MRPPRPATPRRRDADEAGNAEAWEVADDALDRQLAARSRYAQRLADIGERAAATMETA